MKRLNDNMISFWRVFRVIFIVLYLYLIGDIFYRWDGFRNHSTFLDFLPNVALVTILWAIVAVFIALIIWLMILISRKICLWLNWKVGIEHVMMTGFFFIVLGVVALTIRKTIFTLSIPSPALKQIAVVAIAIISIFMARLFANLFDLYIFRKWVDVFQQRITPLVFLFGIMVIISIPIVTYTCGDEEARSVTSHETVRPYGAGKSRPNIIMVTFDALTSLNMSAYGYHIPTTPFISEWVKKASVFSRLKAASNWTKPTAASIITGKRVWTHRSYHSEGSGPLKSGMENIALLMRNNGYFTMAFIQGKFANPIALDISDSFHTAPLASTFIMPASLIGNLDKMLFRLFADNFQLFDWIVKEDFILHKIVKFTSSKMLSSQVAPEKVFDKLLSIVDSRHPKPYFAWIHVMPPHYPFLPPEPYMGMFEPSSEMRTLKSQEQNMHRVEKYHYKYEQFPEEVQPVVDIFRGRYDEFIRYCDEQFKDFVGKLESRKELANTVVILSSDHGESFEHNIITHGGRHLYEQMTNIPLIIKMPGQTEGRFIDDLVEQIDISSTILDLADIPEPTWTEGRSLVPLMHDIKVASRPVFSMNFEKNFVKRSPITKGTIALWEKNYKLIHYLEENKSLLFDLEKDPGEVINLFDKEPEVGRRLLAVLQDRLEEANRKIKSSKDNK